LLSSSSSDTVIDSSSVTVTDNGTNNVIGDIV
jgi:hypothetical protein